MLRNRTGCAACGPSPAPLAGIAAPPAGTPHPAAVLRAAGARMGRRPRTRWPGLFGALAILTVPARAEDAAALLARAPALALEGQATPLAAPVEVATAGWGPFRRLCVAQAMLRPSDGAEVETSPPSCFTVRQAREDGGTWHLALRTEMRGRGPDIDITVSRAPDGRFGPVAIEMPRGVTPPAPQQAAALRGLFQAALQAHGLVRTTIGPGRPFVMPLPLGAVDSDMRVEGGGFACDPEGEAVLRGRRVVVAACTARATGQVSPGRGMVIDIAGRFAIDVGTGMVLQHGYASHLVMDADPHGSMERMVMRGASRQNLE